MWRLDGLMELNTSKGLSVTLIELKVQDFSNVF